jgi:hypothetical protein
MILIAAGRRTMTLRPCRTGSAAAWITTSDLPWQQLVTFGPSGFDAYARLRFLPDPLVNGQPEASVGEDTPSEHELLRATLEVLRRHTEAPEDVYFCMWDGWGSDALPSSVRNGPRVDVPNRTYFLLHGTLSDFADLDLAEASPGRRSSMPDPALMWPADHAWCVARDVDPHYAGIGASSIALEDLLAESGLDIVSVDPRAEQPYYH